MFPQNTDLGNGLSLTRVNRHKITQIKHNGIVIAVVPYARRLAVRKYETFNALPSFVQECAEIVIENERLLA